MDRKLIESKKNPNKSLIATENSRSDGEALLKPNGKSDGKNNERDDGVTYERVQKLRNTRDAYIVTCVSK